jgi:hypothetical protein
MRLHSSRSGSVVEAPFEADAMREECKVEVVGRELCYQGFFSLERVHLRHSLHRGGMSAPGAWLLDIVAGLMEAGEPPEDVARRESAEEAGLAVRRIEPIARFFATPSKSSELTHLYCGEVDASGAGDATGGARPDDHPAAIRSRAVPGITANGAGGPASVLS